MTNFDVTVTDNENNVTISGDDINAKIDNIDFASIHNSQHIEGGGDELDVEKLNIAGDFDLETFDLLAEGSITVWDNDNNWIPQGRLENDSVTLIAGDGFKPVGRVELGSSISLNIEPEDFAGDFLADNGDNDLDVLIGRGLEDDGSGSIQIDEDTDLTFTQQIDFSAGLDTQGDVTDGAQVIWDASAQEIPDSAFGSIDNPTLTNDNVTVNANDGLVGGGTVALGSSIGLDIEPADFAGTYLADDGLDNLEVLIGRGLENDGSGNIQFDEDTGYTFTSSQTFSAGVETNGDVTDGATLIYDSSLSQIEQDALENDSVTIDANDGLKSGGTVALGSNVGLDIEPADFAGLFLSDDGFDDLQVDIGRGLENDGSGNIQFDEDTGYTFTVAQQFNAGITVTGTVSLPNDSIDASEADIGRGLEDSGSGEIQFDEDIAYTFTADQKVLDDIRNLYGNDDDFSISYNSTSNELEIIDETNDIVKMSFDKAGDVFIPNGDLAVSQDIRDGSQIIWDSTAQEIPDSAMGAITNAALSNDSITINANDGLVGGGVVSLGGAIALDIEPTDFAGTYLADDGADNLEVLIGRGLEDDGSGNIQFDEDTSYTFTGAQTFNTGLDTQGDITDGAQVIWDALAQEIPDSAMGSIANSTLTNSSLTISGGDGLKSGGLVSLGGSTTLDIEPADFAGLFVSDDGFDNLTVDIGRGLENDGSGNIRVDEDTVFSFAEGIDVQNNITDGTQVIWDASIQEIPDSAMGSINNSTLTNSTVTVNANDGLVGGGPVGLGGSIGLDIEPNDFAGSFLADDGLDNLEVLIGRGLEDDGAGNIRFDEDIAYTFTSAQTFNSGLDTQGNITDGAQVIWNASTQEIPDSAMGSIDNATLTNSSLTVSGGDGLKSGGVVSLGGSTTLDIEPSDFAGTYLADDGADNLEVLIGRGLENDGSGNVRVDEDTDFTFTTEIDFSVGLDTQGDISDGAQVIWDASLQEIPDSAMGSIANSTLTNDSITVTAGDGIKGGGTPALGGSTTLNIEPADFAGTFLSDDGVDNLEVDIGTGLENDGAGNIRIDEDESLTWTTNQTFNGGVTAGANIDLQNTHQVTNAPAPVNADDLARKQYVDNSVEGATDIKESVQASSTANIDLASAVDPNPVDGVTLSNGDRVLLQDQTDGTENGIYVATTATDPTTWTRSADADEDSEVTSGLFTFVEAGSTRGNSSFIVTTPDPITLGVTSINFAQFSSAGEINAGDGLKKAGQTLNIEPADFAGTYLSDDGSDNLTVDLGEGLENDGAGNVRVDEDFDYTFTTQIDFTAGLDTQADIVDGAQVIWDASLQEVPDSALGAIDNTTLANDSVTIIAGDGLKNGGAVALGSSTTVDVEPADFAGTGLLDEGSDNLAIDEGTALTWTSPQTFNSGLDAQGDVTDGAQVIWDASAQEIPDSAMGSIENSTLTNSSITVTAGDGLKNGGSVALGASTTLNIEPANFAGAGLQDDGADNLELINDSITVAGNTVSLGGSTAITTGNLSGNTDGLTEGVSNLFYTDERAQDGIGGILGDNFVYNDVTPAITLANDSVTITAGDGLKSGGSVSLGGSTSIDIEPADFAGTFLSDDGTDNLTVDIGTGLENDGSGNIRVDEDFDYTFASQIDFSSGLDTQGDVTDGAQVIWDASLQEIPDSAFGSIDNSTLTNDSVTVTAGNDLSGGGSVALGGSITLDVDDSFVRNTGDTMTGDLTISGGLDTVGYIKFAEGDFDGRHHYIEENANGTLVFREEGISTTERLLIKDNSNIEIPNGSLTLSAGQPVVFDGLTGSVSMRQGTYTDSNTGVSLSEYEYGFESRTPGESWQSALGFKIGQGGQYQFHETSSSGNLLLDIQSGGNIEIPNGSLNLGGNPINDVNGITFANDGFNSLSTGGSGSETLAIRDGANSVDLAVFDEGGNVAIPNSELEVSGGDITSGDVEGAIEVDSKGSIADTGKAQLSRDTDALGYAMVEDVTNQETAMVFLGGTGNSVEILHDSGATTNFTTTEDNDGTTNIYWDATNAQYEINNETGASATYSLQIMKA